MVGRHGQWFDPHPNRRADELDVGAHHIGELHRARPNLVVATYQDDQLARGGCGHGFSGVEGRTCVVCNTLCGRRRPIGLDDHERQVRPWALAEHRPTLHLLTQAKTKDLERGHRLRCVVQELPFGPAAGELNDATACQYSAKCTRARSEQAEPLQHLVEGVTLGGQVMADRVQIADVATIEDGRNRSSRTYRPLAPADPKVVEPRVQYSSANLHEFLTS